MRRFALAIVGVLALACGKDDAAGPPACVPGQSIACACVGGGSGAQSCNHLGRFEPCQCPDAAGDPDLAPDGLDQDQREGDVVEDAEADVAADAEEATDDLVEEPADVAADADVAVADVPEDAAADPDLIDADVDEESGPPPTIQVILTWDTPGDDDPTDTGAGRGSDMDLHFMHPNGVWNQAPWDCFWQNRAPNWGSSGAEDDPRLVIDDTDGWGPETAELDGPEGTADQPVQYKVGVFYFSDHGFGASDVMVRVLIDGEEVFSDTFEQLTNRQFWDVARISWPTREVERIRRLYPSGFP